MGPRVLPAFILLLYSSYASAIPGHPWLTSIRTRRSHTPEQASSPDTSLPKEQYFVQPIDHFDNNGSSYKQRYFVNASFFDGTGPVFLCVGGEGPAFEPSVVVTGGLHCGLLMTYAAEVKALVFAVEHRYYGKSMPVPDLETRSLRWLSAPQALADLANFIRHQNTAYRLTPRNHWVSFGGSYPGMLAGWLRLKYPDLVHAAVASSAPVGAIDNFPGYNDVVAASLNASDVGGSAACHGAIREAFAALGAALGEEAGRRGLVKAFNVCDPESEPLDAELNQMTFMEAVAGIFPIQENDPSCSAPGCNIEQCCAVMTNTSSSPSRDPIDRLAQLTSIAQGSGCLNVAYEDSVAGLKNTTVEGGTERVWFYQTCTEFGFYQTCDPGSECIFTTRPWLNNLTSFTDQCRLAFGIDAAAIEDSIVKTNAWSGGLHPKGSRVLYVNGEIDPWHAASILTSEPGIPALWVPAASHHFWTHAPKPTDQPQVVEARKQILAQVSAWLKEPSVSSSSTSSHPDSTRGRRYLPMGRNAAKIAVHDVM